MNKNLKALHIRFIPEGEQELNISSREFIKKAEFVNIKNLLSGNADDSSEANDDQGNGGNTSGGGGTNTGGNTGGGGNTGSGNNEPIGD